MVNSEVIKKPIKINWINTLFLTITLVLAVFGSIWHGFTYGITWVEFAIFFFWYFACGLSITVGYHRLFSHRSHQAILPLRISYALFGAGAFQNSILEWSSDHRRHHKETDKEGDPYNASRGFWWSHFFWIMVDEEDGVVDYSNVPDLQKDWVVRIQHRFIFTIGFLIGMVAPAIIGYIIGGIPTAIGGFVWGGLVRTVFVHHGTFLINSAAHVWGKQSYTTDNSSKDSLWLAFFTFGEGYHNFHHAFQADYRNGFKWWQWDPSKWWISAWALIKFNSKLKRTSQSSIEAAKMKTKFSIIVEKSEPIHDKKKMEIFEMRCKEYIVSMKKTLRSLDEKREQMRNASSRTRSNISSQISQTKEAIARINIDFQKLLDDMMLPSFHHSV
ncbi:MAG: acyl-CoA desaturase [Euryarchaeota archaeon]|nr:acyl-CoA desaturase [Euryarchaeota archaeon]